MDRRETDRGWGVGGGGGECKRMLTREHEPVKTGQRTFSREHESNETGQRKCYTVSMSHKTRQEMITCEHLSRKIGTRTGYL